VNVYENPALSQSFLLIQVTLVNLISSFNQLHGSIHQFRPSFIRSWCLNNVALC